LTPALCFVIHSHFHVSFTLTSFTAFYFMAHPVYSVAK
jgi:hypothetical protein